MLGGGGALAPKPPWLLCHCYISSVIIIIIIIIIIIDVSFQLLLSLRCAVTDPVEYNVYFLLCGCPDSVFSYHSIGFKGGQYVYVMVGNTIKKYPKIGQLSGPTNEF